MLIKPIILFKYGGNAMINNKLRKNVLKNIISFKTDGFDVVLVHGGGPFINQDLKKMGLKSKFIDGQRYTSKKVFKQIEMTLKGKVNSDLVQEINVLGSMAVGLSGKDGKIVTAEKRFHKKKSNGVLKKIELGQVGDIVKVDISLIKLLLQNNYIPVITCLANDESGNSYNVNGDIFAGHIAGALKANQYVILTDVDGLLRDNNDTKSIISEIKQNELKKMLMDGVIHGGMIPKIESCQIALKLGVKSVKIINGTKPETIMSVNNHQIMGTSIIPN